MENGNAILYVYMEERFEKVGTCNIPQPQKHKYIWANRYGNDIVFHYNTKVSKRAIARYFGKKPKYTYRANKRRRA